MPGNFNMKNALSGLVSTGIPFIFKGMINEWLTNQQIDVKTASNWVVGNKNLLDLFLEYGGTDFENALDRAGAYVKDPSWLTSEWLIDAVRDDHPDISSLFLGWDEGRVWLDFQTEKLRDAFNQQVNHIQPVNKPPSETEPEEDDRSSPAPELAKSRISGSEDFSDIGANTGNIY